MMILFRLMMILEEKKVKENILYYVQEEIGYKSHPFDLFFLGKHNKKDTLVMIDVTAGDSTIAEYKLDRISKWIGEQKLGKYDLKGIVLAPGAEMNNLNKKNDPRAILVGQEEALKLLGGLQQIYCWFSDEEHTVLKKG